LLDLPLQPSAHHVAAATACRWEQQREADEVREHARRQQQSSPDQDADPVEERLPGKPARRQLVLEAEEDAHPLGAGQPGARRAGQQHQADRRQEPDHAPELDEEHELQDGNEHEEQEESAEKRHGDCYRRRAGGFLTGGRCVAGVEGPTGRVTFPWARDGWTGRPPGVRPTRATPSRRNTRRPWSRRTSARASDSRRSSVPSSTRSTSPGWSSASAHAGTGTSSATSPCARAGVRLLLRVDRAVDYAYETVHKFPDKRIFLVGEIIHNPHVNQRMTEMGIEFIYPDDDGTFDFSGVGADDVVIMPAFGVTLEDFDTLRDIGCILVDTTCGSVLHVWKRVENYARDGFTALIHGKYTHEESRATASQVNKHEGGTYIIVRDMDEASSSSTTSRRPGHLTREAFMEHFRVKATPGFDPDVHLKRSGSRTRRPCWRRNRWRSG
jgi:hypothetical protein